MASATQLFSFDPVDDRDILEWLKKQKNMSHAVREAIRLQMRQERSVTLEVVLTELRAIQNQLRQGATRASGDSQAAQAPNDEPVDAARNLDNLIGQIEAGEFD
jgi:hypothetical protein